MVHNEKTRKFCAAGGVVPGSHDTVRQDMKAARLNLEAQGKYRKPQKKLNSWDAYFGRHISNAELQYLAETTPRGQSIKVPKRAISKKILTAYFAGKNKK